MESKELKKGEEDWGYGSDEEDNRRKVSVGQPKKAEVTQEDEKEEEEVVEKVVYVKEVYNKDKYGNIIIDKLHDYVEPKREVKGARIEDVKNQYDMFSGVEGSDEEEVESKIADFSLKDDESKNKKVKKTKKQKDDDLDDILKEFGVDTTELNNKPKEPKAPKEKKAPKEETKKEAPKEADVNKEAKEGDEKEKKKKVVKKVVNKTNSHISEAKREILEKQEALRKKEKKKGM